MKILFSEEQIARRIEELAMEMTAFYAGKPLTAVILMNGGLLFGADLVRAIRIPLRWEAFSVSSYADDVSSGKLKIRSELKEPVEGRHLLVIDDIFDTGLTLNRVVEYLEAQNPLSVRTCVLLNKNVSGKYFMKPDWTGFAVPNLYIIGYGMDSCGEFRNLPYIAVKE